MKVGDRVNRKEFGDGTIIHIDKVENNDFRYYAVEFDSYNNILHNGRIGNCIGGKAHRCFFCKENEIKLIGGQS